MELQPLLYDLLVATMAPTQAWSGADGQVRPHGAQGYYDGDQRILSRAELTVADQEPETIATGEAGPGHVEIIALLRPVDDASPDPTIRLRRRREVTPGVVTEHLQVSVATTAAVTVPLTLTLGCDLAAMESVKIGTSTPSIPAQVLGSGRATDTDTDTDQPGLQWQRDALRVTVAAPGAVVDVSDPLAPRLSWTPVIEPGQTTTVSWRVEAVGTQSPVLAGPGHPVWSTPEVSADDRRLPALLDRSLSDLTTLTMRARFAPEDVFVAAGAPWFFTLFGRDSLWAARMLLPLGTELAAGTLRTLAAKQGIRVEPLTAEQPGKILHEVRATELALADGTVLPPVYYGTVDATPLWVCLLHDAWRWGMPLEEVEALLPAMEAALEWIVEYGDADGDGFLEYRDESGRGLANQGWKDSGDSVQHQDGTLAEGPIALCEVQGYAHEAAMAGAELLEAFGRPGADRWRAWAAELRTRFRAAFWVQDEQGRYPAIALDARKRPVDTVTSNIGHLLGTGLLDADEERLVATRLGSPAMNSGYGLRTMADTSGGYWPLRYHGGAVWPHDTAITIAALSRTGHHEVAAQLAEGLLSAAADVDYRLPELYSGDARGAVPRVVPYPAACRPQAWAAASSVVMLTSALGLRPDVPRGRISIRPSIPAPFGSVQVTGLRLAGQPLAVQIAADGELTHAEIPGSIEIV